MRYAQSGLSLRLATKDPRTNDQGTQTMMAKIFEMITQMQQNMAFKRAVQASSQIQVRTALSDVQRTQALAMVPSQSSLRFANEFKLEASAVRLLIT